MDDGTILARIDEMIAEEHQLRGAPDHGPQDAARLRALEESLDQCWDLLRRRRARREFGTDPDGAQAGPVQQVESYLQ